PPPARSADRRSTVTQRRGMIVATTAFIQGGSTAWHGETTIPKTSWTKTWTTAAKRGEAWTTAERAAVRRVRAAAVDRRAAADRPRVDAVVRVWPVRRVRAAVDPARAPLVDRASRRADRARARRGSQ